MTRHNLLNITRLKQIVPGSQIWHYGSTGSQLVQSSYRSVQSSPQGQMQATTRGSIARL